MISQGLIDLVKASEGFSENPYQDSCGIWTIGFGCTHFPDGTPVNQSTAPITIEHGVAILEALLEQFINGVNALVPDCNQHQKDALTDFAYNLGLGSLKSSTLLKTILINPNDNNIKIQFGLWVYGNGEKLPGLITRRANEVALYFTPIEAT